MQYVYTISTAVAENDESTVITRKSY